MDDDNDWTLNSTNFLNDTSTTLATPTEEDPGYCGEDFKAFGKAYKSIHGYSSLFVCVFGALANTLNLIVLSRREMVNPTNAILTGLALADLLNMIEYIPFTIYMNFLPDANGTQRKTYGWALFVLTHSNFSQVCHTISIWLTLTLAVWRYIMVAMPLKCKTLCSMSRAKWAICSAYLASPLLCIPIYLTFAVSTIQPKAGSSSSSSSGSGSSVSSSVIASSSSSYTSEDLDYYYSTTTTTTTTTTPPPSMNSSQDDLKYIVNLSNLAKTHPALMTINFWIYSVVIKIIPCILLTVVSFRLINSLMEAKKRKDKLLANKRAAQAGSPPGGGRNPTNSRGGGDDGSGGGDRTTRMLLAVLLLFLITEFPQGLLALLTGLLGDSFFKSCYIPMADLMDFFALLNSAINFILYCSMSKKFRDTFSQVFHLEEMAKVIQIWDRHGHRAGGIATNIRGRTRPSINHNHVSSPSANRHLLGNHNHEVIIADGKEEVATAV